MASATSCRYIQYIFFVADKFYLPACLSVYVYVSIALSASTNILIQKLALLFELPENIFIPIYINMFGSSSSSSQSSNKMRVSHVLVSST